MPDASEQDATIGRTNTSVTLLLISALPIHYSAHWVRMAQVLAFLEHLTSDLEMEFAGQIGWIEQLDHGTKNFGMLHKVPFFTSLDYKSRIAICSRLR